MERRVGDGLNLITEKTTKEEILQEYKDYPETMTDIEELGYYESRINPIFYEIPQGSKVLDVGCNNGIFISMLKEKRKCDVYGIDLSEVAIKEAIKKGLNVQIADVENLPFEDNSFDVVTCMEVLSHLFDPIKAIKEMRRVLKKDGFLLGSCPHKNLEMYAWEDKRKHRHYFDENSLTLNLQEGFKRAWLHTLKGGQFAVSLASGFLSDKPCEILFKAGDVNTLGWEAALQDRSILRCWFGGLQSPGTFYYRMAGYADKMQEMGAETHYNPYNENVMNSVSEWAEKIKWLPAERRFVNQHIVEQIYSLWKASDMSIWQITASRDVLLLLTTLRDPYNKFPLHPKKPLLLDMDDWFFDLPSYNIASHPYSPGSDLEKVAYEQIKLSDAVICSTQYLKDKLAEIFPEKPSYVVKNSLDFKIWDQVKKGTAAHESNPELIRIGYTGCGNHSGDLEIIKKPIMALLDEFKNLEFISLPFDCFKDVKHERLLQWDMWVGLSKYPQVMANWELDIGIAPLRDNEFNRVKSNLRWLEYSAIKVPTIASRVYPFEKSIKNGKDGIVVGNSAKEWYDAMKELIVNKKKRTDLGEKSYLNVRKNYDMENVSKTYLSILKEVKRGFIRHAGGMRKVIG